MAVRQCIYGPSLVGALAAFAPTLPQNPQALNRSPTALQYARQLFYADVYASLIPLFTGLLGLYLVAKEYTSVMVPADKPPLDFGFEATRGLHRWLEEAPEVNHLLAGLNTAFVFMQVLYIFLYTWIICKKRLPILAAVLLYLSRGIMGFSTRLPLTRDYLGSEADFPVNNASFFFFYSGHVAGSVLVSLDLRRNGQGRLALAVDAANLMQSIRMLATRGHYTIDILTGVIGGYLCDHLAQKYDAWATARGSAWAEVRDAQDGKLDCEVVTVLKRPSLRVPKGQKASKADR